MRRVVSLALAAFTIAPILFVFACSRAPLGELAMLVADADADWIRRSEPVSPLIYPIEERLSIFEREFELRQLPPSGQVRLKAFRSYRLLVNGSELSHGAPSATPWRRADAFDLSPFLREGQNRVVVEVRNSEGPPVLHLASDDLEIGTGPDWFVTSKDRRAPAVSASEQWPFSVSLAFPSTEQALGRQWPLVAALLALGFGVSLRTSAGSGHAAQRRWTDAGRLRWVLAAAWCVLCANNLPRLEPLVGFDVTDHYDYLAFIVEHGRLPLADDGWEMYQSPLFYLLAAPPYALLSAWLGESQAQLTLRILPMLCGLGQLEVAFRSARLLFPDRDDLQLVGTLVGGFIPLNVYLSQSVSNEPLAGLLAAVLVYRCLVLLAGREQRSLFRASLGLGMWFGLALLTKVSVLVLLPLVLGLIVLLARRAALLPILGFTGVSTALAGWYYLRNWIALGRPFVGGWDASRGFGWWQDPGYRVPADFFSFGAALTHPIYPSVSSFWDGLYATLWADGWLSGLSTAEGAPAWNYDWVVTLCLLSLPMTLAGFAGAARASLRPREPRMRPLVFAVLCVGTYWAATLGYFALVPGYCTVKASYGLAALPCYAVLIAAGFDRVLRSRTTRALAWGYLSVWAVFAYGSYFSLKPV